MVLAHRNLIKDNMTQDLALGFETGFRLEKPDMMMEWNAPLDQLAAKSGGLWRGDRYAWSAVTYLGGLSYPLLSEPGISQSEPFTSISAYVGLNPDGLWDDALSLAAYDKMVIHLTGLFGKPFEVMGMGVQGEKSHVWQVGRAEVRLSIIDQFAFRCYLRVGIV